MAESGFLIWAALAACVLAGCAGSKHLERFEFTRVSMGVPARIVVYSPNHDEASAAAAAAYNRIARLDDCMSDYRPRSELMQLCDHAGEPARPVSDDLFRILTLACGISQASDGAFDISVGPLVKLWRNSRHSGALPQPDELDHAHMLVGSHLIELEPRTHAVRLARPGMRLDLGGIAKGYAAHEAVKVLRAGGNSRCLVALSGDIATGDPPPGAPGWEVEIGLPGKNQAGTPGTPRRLLLSNACVSTSGDTQQSVEIAGVSYSHIVDPRTGLGVTHHTMCTVVAAEGSEADAYSSAACVLGPEKSRALFEKTPRLGVILWADAQDGDSMTVLDPGGRLRFVGGSWSTPHR